MDTQLKKAVGIFARYFFLLIVSLGNLYIFYKILTPVTLFSVSRTLAIFTDVVVKGNLIFLNGFGVELVQACVAGSAFFLMFILVFSIPDMKPKKRFFILLSTVGLLFLFNYLRILFLIFIYPFGNYYFDTIHWVLWHIVSVALVVGVWLFAVRVFRIKKIPVYSDVMYLYSLSKKKKKTKRRKKHN